MKHKITLFGLIWTRRGIRHFFPVILILFAFFLPGIVNAQPTLKEERDCGVIVQFKHQVIEFKGDGHCGDSSQTQIQDETLRELFNQVGIVYYRQIFLNAKKAKIVCGRMRQMPDLSNTFVLTCSRDVDVGTCIRGLNEHSSVVYSEPNYMEVEGLTCPDPVDPYFERDFDDPYQWWLSGARGDSTVNININPAWEITCGESTTTVGLFDSGVMTSHEDIGSRCTNIGGRFGGHGTYVYGILAANANSVGIAGIVQNSEVISWNIANYSFATFADSIVSAVDNWGCDVIGTSSYLNQTQGYLFAVASTLKNAIDYSFDSGVPFVAAAGNDEYVTVAQPACIDEVISVGASDTTDSFVDIDNDGVPDTNHGRLLDILAPGLWMTTTGANGNDDYTLHSDETTSLAQPIVLGGIALMDGAIGSLGATGFYSEDFEGMIYAYAKDLSTAGYDTLSGWGRMDIGRSIQNIGGRYSLIHRQETGGALSDSTSKFKAECYGFTSNGLKHGQLYWMKRFTIEKTVSWPAYADEDSVFCWGLSNESNGLRDYVRKWSYSIDPNFQFHRIFNRAMCYPVHSTIDDNSALFKSFYYRVYYSTTDSVIAVIGESDPDSVVFSFSVVGPDSIPDKVKFDDDCEKSKNQSWTSLNYPNPFNPSTQIDYTVADNMSMVKIGIYDTRGRLIAFIVNEEKNRGSYIAVWDGHDKHGMPQGAGVYIAHVSIGKSFQETRKLVLLK